MPDFKDEYRQEMDKVQASESLFADTVKRMKREQSKLQAQLTIDTQQEPGIQQAIYTPHETEAQPTIGTPDMLHEPKGTEYADVPASPRKRRVSSLLRFGLPAVACLLLVFVGVLTIPQIMESFEQTTQQQYEFAPVEGNASIIGGLQLGSIEQQPDSVEAQLRIAKCPEALLPSGILDATPINIDGYQVYLGFDEQRDVYYAVYLEEDSENTWILLQSVNSDETDFTKALEDYFS